MADAADTVDVEEVVVVVVASTIGAVTIKTEEDEEEDTTTEEAVEAGTMAVVVVDIMGTRAAMEDSRTTLPPCRTRGRHHQATFHHLPPAGFLLRKWGAIRGGPLAYPQRSVRRGWGMHPHNMADRHQGKRGIAAR
jgi:hypothetical protein